ncbi:MAG: glycosyltransferase family 4 protein [Chitinophagaceae bacterium]
MKPIIFINSHPIQYFAPLYKSMNDSGIPTEAWYCNDESVKGGLDRQFGVEVKWDIPLLEGYKSRFFKNYSWKPSHSAGFFGLMNFGMVPELFRIPKSVIVVHGYHYCTHLLILLFGKIKGHTICLRCEMPYSQETLKKGWKQTLKKFWLKRILFPRIHYFLNIGTQNRLFYKSFNVADSRIVFCPYSVDNSRFRTENDRLTASKVNIRKELNIPETAKVIVYSGKYMDKKKPLDLLQAYIRLNDPNCWLIMIGEGELRQEMENLISGHQLTNVILTGFVNQSKISEYYAVGNVFVMCSTIGETWGLSVNEAMNFDLPLVVSDLTGCSADLVKPGVNGYVFKTGNIEELTAKLHDVLIGKKLSWNNSSQHIVDLYSYSTICKNIRQVI